jgi:hypothetical protein
MLAYMSFASSTLSEGRNDMDDYAPLHATRSARLNLIGLDYGSAVFAILLIIISSGLFLLTQKAKEVNDLVKDQNIAALKLEENVKYYQWLHDNNNTGKSSLFPPGLFEEMVNFSRNNAKIMYAIRGLPFWRSKKEIPDQECQHENHWCSTLERIIHRFPPQNGVAFDHVVVDPEISPSLLVDQNIVKEGFYQIRLYQQIRDYAQDTADAWSSFILAITTCCLPIAYAVLGALFQALRQPEQARIIHRLVMAGVAGFAVSRLSDLLPQDVLLPPLAIAFVVGYSTEILTSRLDELLRGKRRIEM